MFTFLKKYKFIIILFTLIIIYIAYFTTASFLRYDNFYTGRYDLGNMDQTVWNTVNGRIFQISGDKGQAVLRLAYHADFILILLSPLYLILSNPKMLLLIQSAIISIGAIYIYLIAKEILKNKNLALIFSFSYLMCPLIQYANLFDFHPVALATAFLLASFYYLIKKRYILLSIFLFLSGITKEEIWLTVAIFGIALIFQKGKNVKILGSIVAVSSLSFFIYLVKYAIPQALGSGHFALSYFSIFGDSPLQIISNIMLSPQKTLSLIINQQSAAYFKMMLMPIGFLSILNPLTLIFAVPDIMINLLSSNQNLRQIYYHYFSAITPFVYISAIYGTKKILTRFPKKSTIFIFVYVLFFSFFSAYIYGPLPLSKRPNVDMFVKPSANREIITDMLKKIPERYSVAATNNMGSHLSQRETIYTIPYGIDKADIVVFRLNDGYARPSLSAQKQMAADMNKNIRYEKFFEKDDFVIFKKRGLLL